MRFKPLFLALSLLAGCASGPGYDDFLPNEVLERVRAGHVACRFAFDAALSTH